MIESRVGYDELWERELFEDELGKDVLVNEDKWLELLGCDDDDECESNWSSADSSDEDSPSSSDEDEEYKSQIRKTLPPSLLTKKLVCMYAACMS